MSKKRPRSASQPAGPSHSTGSKQDPGYWQNRLFKSRYTYRGRRFEVRNWSVKIQYQGKRKTFSLRSGHRDLAAAEACGLYRRLVARGWGDLATPARWSSAGTHPGRVRTALAAADKADANYWAQRLIRRPYTMNVQAAGERELSVRLDHGGNSNYFPLGTDDRELATRRALQIYRTVAGRGWEAANQRFSRELTVAFRWLDNPLAWTYTTIHTQVNTALNPPAAPSRQANDRFKVGVAESDGGIRGALEWCLNQMEGMCCLATFTSMEEVFQGVQQKPLQLVLVSHNLSDGSGTACLEEMRAVAPEIGGLLYSVYEDSEELFRTTPGGAGTYVLRRTPPTGFLEPIRGLLKHDALSGREMTPAVWQYFKDHFALPPSGGLEPQLASLTQREHEVLGLLSKGHPDKEIADELGISIHTVHEHVRNIFEKLHVHNRTEAVVKFLQK